MQNKNNKTHIIDILFVLALFAVFAFCALILVILGANIYKNTVASMNDNFTSRIAYSYISEKIRQNDTYECISIGELEGTQALVFSTDVYGSQYATYIYYHDGNLKELFMRAGSDIGSNPLNAGTPIMELKEFRLEYVNQDLIAITFHTTGDDSKTVYASLRSKTKEVLP